MRGKVLAVIGLLLFGSAVLGCRGITDEQRWSNALYFARRALERYEPVRAIAEDLLLTVALTTVASFAGRICPLGIDLGCVAALFGAGKTLHDLIVASGRYRELQLSVIYLEELGRQMEYTYRGYYVHDPDPEHNPYLRLVPGFCLQTFDSQWPSFSFLALR